MTHETCCQKPQSSQKTVSPSSCVMPHIHRMSPVSAADSIGGCGLASLRSCGSDAEVAKAEPDAEIEAAGVGEGERDWSGWASGERLRLRAPLEGEVGAREAAEDRERAARLFVGEFIA